MAAEAQQVRLSGETQQYPKSSPAKVEFQRPRNMTPSEGGDTSHHVFSRIQKINIALHSHQLLVRQDWTVTIRHALIVGQTAQILLLLTNPTFAWCLVHA